MAETAAAAGTADVYSQLDPLFLALTAFRQRRYPLAAQHATNVLNKNPLDQAAWCVKMRSLTEQVYVDEVDNDELGIAEEMMDDNAIAQVARPGTSFNKPNTAAVGAGMPSQAIRPRTQTGRPVTGVVRPGTRGARPGTMEQALRAPRTASTARPVTSSTARFVRMGTASMMSSPDGPFLNVSRLNLSKYAANASLAPALFEHLFFHENDVRTAMQLAALATQNVQFQSTFWKNALGKCYYRMGLYRDAEKQFKSAQNQQSSIESALLLGKVYQRLDQPLTAIEIYTKALDEFTGDVSLLCSLARVHEALNDVPTSVKYYKEVLKQDSTNVEAIACIATNHFYGDQPEVALAFYRRLLQMGVSNAELFTNLGLCCFYAQQFDLAVGCFERAVTASDNDNQADIWYNIAHVALASGDVSMAYQCLRLAIAANNDHAEAYTNLAVVEMRKGNVEQAKTLLLSAMQLGSYTFEPFYNYALLCVKIGDYQAAHSAVTKSLQLFPEHSDSALLYRQIDALLGSI